ncbi:transcriptional regulator [Thermoproteota archaeon]
MPSKDIIEQNALKLIFEAGEEGLFQSKLWKTLEVSSREGSRIANKFEEKGKVIRKKVLNEGRWTYKLFFKKEPVTLESVEGCPCLICPEVDKCFRGGKQDPNICLDLTAWIDSRIDPQSE